jgi:acetyltransferase EpsM
MQSFVVYGAGGYAKLIIDLIEDVGGTVVCVFDDNEAIHGMNFMGFTIEKYDSEKYKNSSIVIAIGNNSYRKKCALRLAHKYTTLIHPDAFVSKKAVIGVGSVILAKAVIQTNVNIGQHVIVNAGSCIDHDAEVEDFVHINPLGYIGGGAKVESEVEIGVGAVVMRNVRVPSKSSILAKSLINH